MDLSEHATMMGKLLLSFQCLEYALRVFLYDQRDPPHEPLAPGTDLDTMTFGVALIKFTRPYAGRVEVGFREELSKDWMENQIKRVLAECAKVGRAASSGK